MSIETRNVNPKCSNSRKASNRFHHMSSSLITHNISPQLNKLKWRNLWWDFSFIRNRGIRNNKNSDAWSPMASRRVTCTINALMKEKNNLNSEDLTTYRMVLPVPSRSSTTKSWPFFLDGSRIWVLWKNVRYSFTCKLFNHACSWACELTDRGISIRR